MLRFPDGAPVPRLGQGTWNMGDASGDRARELAALRRGLDLGLTLIDTAEMYGSGRSESLVGEAIAGRRDEVYLVSKVLPSNANRTGTLEACRGSLKRLKTEALDLYLLHWRGAVPLGETVDAMRTLVRAGDIRAWGVSNFDCDDMEELLALTEPGEVVTNQVLYNLGRRGPELDLFPACARAGVSVMAYSPIEQGRLLRHPALGRIAEARGATPAQIALAFALERPEVWAIPKAGSAEHVEDNAAALGLELTDEEREALDAAFPAPSAPTPLEMI